MSTIRIYSDESRHRNEKFLLLGSIWIDEKNVIDVKNLIESLRKKYGYTNSEGKEVDFLGEFKWSKVSDKYLNVYQDLVDIFFDCIDKDIFRSCIMLVDTQDPEIISQNNIKKEGFIKLLYQLYLHNSHIPATYKIYPDSITNPQHQIDLNTLYESLNNALRKKFSLKVNPEYLQQRYVNNITPVDSKKVVFIQLIDIIMGGIGYYQNGFFDKVNAKQSKVKLMKYILDKIVFAGTFQFTGKKYIIVKSTKFNIWLFRPKNKNSPPEGELFL
jgi:hypothetical protein